MTIELILPVSAIVLAGLIYFAGVQRGSRQERERQKQAQALEAGRRDHDRRLEQERRAHEMVSAVADEYVDMVRRHHDSGPHALARLGLERLGSDPLIRQAIREMQLRTNGDPWAGQSQHVENVDLVAFFRVVSERRVNFFRTTVESVAHEVPS